MDPPENLRVFDPGYLGLLQISWGLPKSVNVATECRRYYQLEYFDTNSDRWTVGGCLIISLDHFTSCCVIVIKDALLPLFCLYMVLVSPCTQYKYHPLLLLFNA